MVEYFIILQLSICVEFIRCFLYSRTRYPKDNHSFIPVNRRKTTVVPVQKNCTHKVWPSTFKEQLQSSIKNVSYHWGNFPKLIFSTVKQCGNTSKQHFLLAFDLFYRPPIFDLNSLYFAFASVYHEFCSLVGWHSNKLLRITKWLRKQNKYSVKCLLSFAYILILLWCLKLHNYNAIYNEHFDTFNDFLFLVCIYLHHNEYRRKYACTRTLTNRNRTLEGYTL